jgi:translation initiation factor IF-3
VEADLAECSVVEQFPRMEGRLMVMVLAPKKAILESGKQTGT